MHTRQSVAVNPHYQNNFSAAHNDCEFLEPSPVFETLISQPTTSELIDFSRADVTKQGEIYGQYSLGMRGMGNAFVSTPVNDAMGLICSKNSYFSIPLNKNGSDAFVDGDLVAARVTEFYPPTLRDRVLQAWRVLPKREERNSTNVLRILRRDALTGRISLDSASPNFPTITESDATSIYILGHARPDHEREDRFKRNRETADMLLGYADREAQIANSDELRANPIHAALEQAIAEETENPDGITDLIRGLLDPTPRAQVVGTFREEESAYGASDSHYPVDRLCARMFRAGQLSQGLETATDGLYLLRAEEISGVDSTGRIVNSLVPSPLYRELIANFRRAENALWQSDLDPVTPLVRLCARTFRAGQLGRKLVAC